MQHGGPALLHALEMSALGAGIRQSAFIYPLANVVHVLAVIVMGAAVALLDLRLLGALREIPAARLVGAARRWAAAAFAVVALSGFALFVPEASHIALNPVFLAKMAVIALALGNVLLFEFAFSRRLAGLPPGAAMPLALRASAAASLGLWLAVAALGRAIAYF